MELEKSQATTPLKIKISPKYRMEEEYPLIRFRWSGVGWIVHNGDNKSRAVSSLFSIFMFSSRLLFLFSHFSQILFLS